ncbi:uncharacterized protein LOC128126727 isoform X1 [Lactuca sativa]|uniref:uncharacterized protein LOC128126727 isoform X1 n=1 Tax=Lactuca sativa TaxID=4236 RepID=UPI0022AFF8C7|nr:uncharacterized protein LOC128126727 isoform X1 [Lactuca sativa]XP_052620709.1 uncharacterized protein LOC128126727 isoform X1 [Lactuca sativa]XP_052620710.1 uncharacterized protein LOC128126727 isoform X1 [Lactuca sativa]XP_052620711.1 uncharacterized protein LOC128126727 isoform X1 [Lactuca sativa]XP_052620713.1 uncharacterized protein LOC128126727 isoform X1 [Lactuca sativa]XP_052620714.1 uncharacterized protein LOC128126727 isoform X1 [Lactuca sativa]XP_052620715.1 uncharacterized prot
MHRMPCVIQWKPTLIQMGNTSTKSSQTKSNAGILKPLLEENMNTIVYCISAILTSDSEALLTLIKFHITRRCSSYYHTITFLQLRNRFKRCQVLLSYKRTRLLKNGFRFFSFTIDPGFLMKNGSYKVYPFNSGFCILEPGFLNNRILWCAFSLICNSERITRFFTINRDIP